MSRIIRGGGGGGPRGVVPREVYDATEEAKRIVDEAQARATELVGAARDEAASIREDAARAGRDESRAQAAALLAEASAIRDRALRAAERETAEVAIAVARRILGEEIALAPERVTALVGEVLARARRANDVTVTLHPDDAATLRSVQDTLLERAGRPARFTIVEDPSLTRGGCIVRTELGQLDARIEVQLEALASALGIER
jgi:type III secretion system HrpE/YscL family protein